MSIRGRAARPCLPFTAPCGALSGQVGVYPSATAEARRGQRQGAVWLFPVLFSKCLYETGRRLTPPVPMGKPMSARPEAGPGLHRWRPGAVGLAGYILGRFSRAASLVALNQGFWITPGDGMNAQVSGE